MIGRARLAALAVLVGLVLLIGLGISSPGLSSADQHTTTTTAAPATTTTAAPATTTTAAPATTTTAAPATTTTTARSTSTTAPTSATTAPGSPPPPEAPSGAGSTGPVSEPDAQTPTKVGGTTASRAPSRLISEPAPNRPTTKEFRQERRLAPPPEPSDAGPQQNLAPLLEPERVRPVAGEPERAGLPTKPLATGGLVLGAVAGLLLGLADRAAGLSARSR